MVKLKIHHGYPKDLGQKKARISLDVFRKYSFTKGEVVEVVSGIKRTPVKVFPLEVNEDLEDSAEYEGLIIMDGLIRASIDATLGEIVRVDKTIVKSLNHVVLQPLSPLPKELESEELRQLLDFPLTKLDIVELKIQSRSSKNDETKSNIYRFIVSEVDPDGIGVVKEGTQIDIHEGEVPTKLQNLVTYEDFGGYWNVKERIHDLIELPLRNPDLFRSLHIEFPKGVLIYGPSGVGKTALAKTLASESQVHIVEVDVSNILTGDMAESERHLNRYFREAKVHAPSILLIDDLEIITEKRDEVSASDTSRRITTTFLKNLDDLNGKNAVLLIGTTSQIDKIDPSFRRPGRFDIEIEMGPPSTEDREEILMVFTRTLPISSDIDIRELAERTRGFLSADLMMLVKQAALNGFRRLTPSVDLGTALPSNLLKVFSVEVEDFEEALKLVLPSATKEILADIPNVKWEDIGGLEDVKQKLKESVEWPIQFPNAFKEMGISSPSGVLLYGPPGTGKTLLAKAVASESKCNFLVIRGSELTSKWFGETERAISELFRKARSLAPSVVFFDEIDSLMRSRGSSNSETYMDRIINTFLAEMDGIDRKGQVVIIGATNRPELLDPAVLRPGRFDRLLYIPTPDEEARRKIFEVHTSKMPIGTDVDIDTLAKRTEFFVGADIENLCREAAIISLREDINSRVVLMSHFEKALSNAIPTMSKELVAMFDNLSKSLRGRITSNLSDVDTYA